MTLSESELRANAASRQALRRSRQKPVHGKIIAEFLDRPCVDCGVKFPEAAMQADHVRGKLHKISWFKGGNGSESGLRRELAKCEVRCANCHCIRHANGGTCNG